MEARRTEGDASEGVTLAHSVAPFSVRAGTVISVAPIVCAVADTMIETGYLYSVHHSAQVLYAVGTEVHFW